MRKSPRGIAVLGLTVIAGLLFSAQGSIAAASVRETHSVSEKVTFYDLDRRLVTLRQIDNTARSSIDRAQPGDLVSLTDRTGREWVAVVPPGADHAATPWVIDATSGRARTVQGKEIVIAIQ